MLWMGALKAGSRMRWMDMLTADEAHVDPAALLIIRTEADVRALLPLVREKKEIYLYFGRSGGLVFVISPASFGHSIISINYVRLVKYLMRIWHEFSVSFHIGPHIR